MDVSNADRRSFWATRAKGGHPSCLGSFVLQCPIQKRGDLRSGDVAPLNGRRTEEEVIEWVWIVKRRRNATKVEIARWVRGSSSREPLPLTFTLWTFHSVEHSSLQPQCLPLLCRLLVVVLLKIVSADVAMRPVGVVRA